MSKVLTLEKGVPIIINKESPNLKNLYIGMGLNKIVTSGDFDWDVTAVLCGANGKLIDSNHLNYYGNLTVNLGGVDVATHSADDFVGDPSVNRDDEFVNLRLDKMPTSVQHIFVMVNIYEAKSRNQHLGMVENSFIRLMDGETEKEFARYDFEKEFADHSGIMVAEIYRFGDEWKAKIIAEPVDGGIDEILKARNLE